nr:hypothetical protein [Clostridia bacterium]
METSKSVKDGVISLIDKNKTEITATWDYFKKGANDMTDSVAIDGKTYPLFYWRSDPQIEAIARNAKNNIGGSVSVKISGMVSKNYGVNAFLYKELDTAEWVLDSEIKKITACVNKNAINATLLMKNGKVALLELGATLPDGAEEQTRHTAWGKQGMESTRVVSTKVRPQSVYLFTDRIEPYAFNDATLELYGLTLADATAAVAVYKAISGKTDLRFNIERDKKLRFYMEKVYESDKIRNSVEI